MFLFADIFFFLDNHNLTSLTFHIGNNGDVGKTTSLCSTLSEVHSEVAVEKFLTIVLLELQTLDDIISCRTAEPLFTLGASSFLSVAVTVL